MLAAAFLFVVFSGCATNRKLFPTFPVVSDLKTASEPMKVLDWARSDFDSLARGEEPKYATFETGLYDGGTRIFRGAGYRIVDHHQAKSDGVFLIGQTLSFDKELSGGDVLECSNVRLGKPRDTE